MESNKQDLYGCNPNTTCTNIDIWNKSKPKYHTYIKLKLSPIKVLFYVVLPLFALCWGLNELGVFKFGIDVYTLETCNYLDECTAICLYAIFVAVDTIIAISIFVRIIKNPCHKKSCIFYCNGYCKPGHRITSYFANVFDKLIHFNRVYTINSDDFNIKYRIFYKHVMHSATSIKDANTSCKGGCDKCMIKTHCAKNPKNTQYIIDPIQKEIAERVNKIFND